jgi:phosphoglucosamine mutase
LNGLKIVLDCANGAAYKVAPLIFKELEANLIVLANHPDGNNINKDCGALHPEVARAGVLGHSADLGITLDGDADRVIMVDNKGNIIDGDFILAISALHLLKNKKLSKNTVVVTEYTNLAFDALINKEKGKCVRTKNGDRYVIEEMDKHDYNLGGEFSGHIIFSDFNTTGDGIIAALQILNIMKQENKSLSELASVLKKYPQITVNVKVKEKIPLVKLKSVQSEIKEAEIILGKEGRHLVRYSGTEMIARVMIEGKDEDLITKLANNIANKIKEVGNAS